MDKSFFHSWLKDLGGHGFAGPSSIYTPSTPVYTPFQDRN